jgi:hypothetical protein
VVNPRTSVLNNPSNYDYKMKRNRKKQIVYDESLAVEKKEYFVSTKLGKHLSETKKRFEALPADVKWLIALFVSSVASGLVSIAVMIYFDMGFKTLEEVAMFLKVQFIIDVVLILMISVFIFLVIKEAES